FDLRAAEQSDYGESRCAAVDRPHHDHLGHPGDDHRHGHRIDQLWDRALSARRRRGRVLPRAHSLFHLLVPELPSWRIVSGFLTGLPIAVALGAPISTALLGLDGWFGLRGWQIMYIAEGFPTVLIGVLTLFVLTDRPEQARFLSAAEKT